MKKFLPNIILLIMWVCLFLSLLWLSTSTIKGLKETNRTNQIKIEVLQNKCDGLLDEYELLYEVYEECEADKNALAVAFDRLTNKYETLNAEYVENSLRLIEPLREYDKLEYMYLYKTIIDDDSGDFVYEYFTQEEVETIWSCIETETYQCPFEAKINVVSVILNRVESNRFPNDVVTVITAPNQFATGRKNITSTTKLALEYVLLFGDNTDGCVGFRAKLRDGSTPPYNWNGWTRQFTDGKHYFYK